MVSAKEFFLDQIFFEKVQKNLNIYSFINDEHYRTNRKNETNSK